ncbi:hypothetical protein SAMN02745121_04068 [Nannocystis exedens]|uniref:Cytochrome P460 n=1 Tax=Nannocystis exedens TaxID=54 RepID=A0A1I2A4J3_9BACT|nr:hypothetical protein [Nannocystis exedens]PCC69644.1 hypothetical protein NAEX_02668 [Nannocystis exedens]SFE38965.1 hypothetical protein SAMN02745121_04068 [Nannocystis exedens]
MSSRPQYLLCLLLFAACGETGGTTTAASTGTDTTNSSTGPATTGTGETPTTGDASSSTSDASSSSTSDASSSSTTGSGEDLEMQAEDFTCILEWEKVRKFRITNLLGHMDEALEVANSPTGGVYPVGTVIQLIPGEAMVKRAAGWAPDNSDWEFFALEVSAEGTTIMARGTQDVVNGFGGNCFDCHAKAAPQWDRICEEGHGCDPLPITPEQIEMVQMADPRCQ